MVRAGCAMHDIATADVNDVFNDGHTLLSLFLYRHRADMLYDDKLAMNDDNDDGRPLNQIVVFYR